MRLAKSLLLSSCLLSVATTGVKDSGSSQGNMGLIVCDARKEMLSICLPQDTEETIETRESILKNEELMCDPYDPDYQPVCGPGVPDKITLAIQESILNAEGTERSEFLKVKNYRGVQFYFVRANKHSEKNDGDLRDARWVVEWKLAVTEEFKGRAEEIRERIDAIFKKKDGWRASGIDFRLVDEFTDNPYHPHFTIRLAEPEKMGTLCRPFNVGRMLSCRIGRNANLNSYRLAKAPRVWRKYNAEDVDPFQQAVYHEVGHLLGLKHPESKKNCVTPSVMEQQARTLGNCERPSDVPNEDDIKAMQRKMRYRDKRVTRKLVKQFGPVIDKWKRRLRSTFNGR